MQTRNTAEIILQATSFSSGPLTSPHPNLNRFLLPNGEHVACVFWNGLYHITGTDIGKQLRTIMFKLFSNGSASPCLSFRSVFQTRPEHQEVCSQNRRPVLKLDLRKESSRIYETLSLVLTHVWRSRSTCNGDMATSN